MPFADISDGKIYYQFDGAPDAPVLMFSNSLGATLSMWDRQVPTLSKSFRVLRYDGRGQGKSLVTRGPYRIEQLARDAITLLDALGVACVDFCGLSMGGMVGMWIAAHEPSRVDRLVLANTSAVMGPHDIWEKRIAAVQNGGMASIAAGVIDRWFTPMFCERSPNTVNAVRHMLLGAPPEGYAACCAAIRDMDQRGDVPAIRANTLVITGMHDPATPPAASKAVADAIAGATFMELSAAHLSNIEAADRFNDAVADFLLA